MRPVSGRANPEAARRAVRGGPRGGHPRRGHQPRGRRPGAAQWPVWGPRGVVPAQRAHVPRAERVQGPGFAQEICRTPGPPRGAGFWCSTPSARSSVTPGGRCCASRRRSSTRSWCWHAAQLLRSYPLSRRLGKNHQARWMTWGAVALNVAMTSTPSVS